MSHTKHHHDHTDSYAVHECDGAEHEHHHHADGSCCCEHHAQEFHGIEKPLLIRLIIAAVLFLCAMLLPIGETILFFGPNGAEFTMEALFMILSAILSGYDVIISAVKNLLKLRFFDEYFLMSFAAIVACIIGEYEEGASVFLLYRIGEFCQAYAIRHSKKTIYALTGDCGCEPPEASSSKFITRFARVYTPVILILAVLIAAMLPIVTDTTFKDAVYRGLTFLVLACPCAIVISVPLAYFAGIACGTRKGIYFRDTYALEVVAKQDPKQITLKNASIKYKTAYAFSLSDSVDAQAAELVMTGEDTALAVRIARKARRIAKENVIFTILIKVTVLILAVCGISALWFAVFADSGVTVVTVLNSLRSFHASKTK